MSVNPRLRWNSAPNAQRTRKKCTFTLSDEARARLEDLAAGGPLSAVVERLIMEAEK